jgi:cytochrome d ubiquinol oxidase subunit I
MYLIGWVDEANQTTTGLKIPCLLSLLAYMDPATVTGLEAFPPAEYPPINLVFQVYHLMIVLGSLYIPIGFVERSAVFLEAQVFGYAGSCGCL